MARRNNTRRTKKRTKKNTQRVKRIKKLSTQRRVKRKDSSKKEVNKYINYDLFNGLKWDNYRLGDVLFGYFACWDDVCLHKNNPNM